MLHEQKIDHPIIPADKKVIRKIWMIAGILGVVTAIEYIFAFSMHAGGLRNFIFIALTFVKAFFIMSEFMHMGHEKKALAWSVLGPLVLLMWLVLAFYFESTALENALSTIWGR